MALITKPDLLIADEPTTALDVTVQAQILELMKKMRSELGMAVILISHDLGVVSGFCDRAMVMYAGRVMETRQDRGPLLPDQASLHPGPAKIHPRAPRQGNRTLHHPRRAPGHAPPQAGCPFAPRCDFAVDYCSTEEIAATDVAPGHGSACLRVQKENLAL